MKGNWFYLGFKRWLVLERAQVAIMAFDQVVFDFCRKIIGDVISDRMMIYTKSEYHYLTNKGMLVFDKLA